MFQGLHWYFCVFVQSNQTANLSPLCNLLLLKSKPRTLPYIITGCLKSFSYLDSLSSNILKGLALHSWLSIPRKALFRIEQIYNLHFYMKLPWELLLWEKSLDSQFSTWTKLNMLSPRFVSVSDHCPHPYPSKSMGINPYLCLIQSPSGYYMPSFHRESQLLLCCGLNYKLCQFILMERCHFVVLFCFAFFFKPSIHSQLLVQLP